MAELWKLAQDCNFGDSLTVMLRDILVCRINDDSIQRKLLLEDGLTFETALKKAQTMEATNKDIKELNSARESVWWSRGAEDFVNEMADVRVRPLMRQRKCYRCGGTSHLANGCRFAEEQCHNCGKKGHIKRACR